MSLCEFIWHDGEHLASLLSVSEETCLFFRSKTVGIPAQCLLFKGHLEKFGAFGKWEKLEDTDRTILHVMCHLPFKWTAFFLFSFESSVTPVSRWRNMAILSVSHSRGGVAFLYIYQCGISLCWLVTVKEVSNSSTFLSTMFHNIELKCKSHHWLFKTFHFTHCLIEKKILR